MLNDIFKYGISLTILLFATSVIGQSGTNSPFSRFGIGDLRSGNLVHLQSMGGLEASFTDPYHANIKNPAALAFQQVISYDVGMNMRYANLADTESSENILSGNLENIAFSIPLFNNYNELLEVEKRQYWLATGFSLSQHSDVNYDVSVLDELPDVGLVRREFAGNGGTYRVQWGNAFKYKNLSVGANLGYLFGQLVNERNVRFEDIMISYDNNFLDVFSLRGFTYNLGAIYQHILNKQEMKDKIGTPAKYINVGIYGNSTTSFSTNATVSKSSFLAIATGAIVQDSAFITTDVPGEGRMPSELGIGMTYYSGNKLALGVNYSITNWSKYRNDARPEELSNASKITFGGYYRPNIRSFRYTDRMYYRFGVFYGNDPRSINSLNLNNYGITLGTGLPFVNQRKISHLNLGLTIGQRGNSALLRESYISLGVGMTFNDDEWFIKRKYN